jgi:hypothetical protein
MSPQLIRGLVDALIPLAGGVLATAYGWGWVGGKQTPAAKAKDVLRIVGPLLVAYGLVMTIRAVVVDRSATAEGRVMFVAAANGRAGDDVDEETRLISVIDEGTHIQFDYSLHRLRKDQMDIPALEQAMDVNMRATLCADATGFQTLQAWGPFSMRYFDAQGVVVAQKSMVAADCP